MIAASILLMAAAGPVNLPVTHLDLPRYLGQWHEIAHLPMYFQRNCVDRTTATYTRLPDGNLQVDNTCRNKSGKMDRSIGAARPVPGSPGKLEVRFAPAWLTWLPAVWADYWIIDLDPDYQWAVVGGPSKKYLWILSRDPTLPKPLFTAITARAKARGYPVEKLVMTAEVK